MESVHSHIKTGRAAAMFCAIWAVVASMIYGFGIESIIFISGYSILSVLMNKPGFYPGIFAILITVIFSIAHLAMFHPVPVALFFVTLMFYFVRYTVSSRKINSMKKQYV